MFKIIKHGTTFNFVSKFPYTGLLSLVLVIGSLVLLFTKLDYGVDFRGGAEIQMKFDKTVNTGELRAALSELGYKSSTVQTIGAVEDHEFIVKVQTEESKLNSLSQEIGDKLKERFTGHEAEVRKVDIVGPKAGAQLRISGFQAMLWAMIAIMVYVGLRFDFKYSPGAILALFHDVSIIVGIFALTGTEFTLQTVAALLAVIGYSVNDTVVVYDRVREHEEKYAGVPLREHINNAINETLSRTILTSGTTLFVSAAMYFWGGAAIKDFFFAITLGVVVGTYSSIFVAAPVTLIFNRFQKPKKA